MSAHTSVFLTVAINYKGESLITYPFIHAKKDAQKIFGFRGFDDFMHEANEIKKFTFSSLC